MGAGESPASHVSPACALLATAELRIDGMSCGACVKSVEGALARLAPGAVVASQVRIGVASVRYRAELISDAALLEGAWCTAVRA